VETVQRIAAKVVASGERQRAGVIWRLMPRGIPKLRAGCSSHPGGTNFNENLRPRDVIFSRRRRGTRRKIQVRSGTRLFTVLCRCLQCGCKPCHVVPVGARLEVAVEVDRHLDGRVPELFGDVGNGHCSVTGILSRCDRLTGRFLVPRLRPRLHGSDRPSVSGGWCVAGSGSFVAVQCLCWPS